MRWAVILLVLAGCSSPSVTPPGVDAALEDDATDVVTPMDLVTPTVDTPRADAPRMDAPRDTPDTATEDAPTVAEDVVIDPGMCGAAVRTCFCNCGANAVCQQGCINRDQDCGFCVYLAATRCCPAQSEVLDRCIDASMCTDDPCIRTRCAGEVGAFEGCFASSQRTEPACQAEMRTCLGSDFPQVRCVVQR